MNDTRTNSDPILIDASIEQQISALLTVAQKSAARSLDGTHATDTALVELASRTRERVIAQVLAGLWSPFGLSQYDDISPLVVTARLGNRLIGEPPIKVEFDWVGTKIRMLMDKGARAPS